MPCLCPIPSNLSNPIQFNPIQRWNPDLDVINVEVIVTVVAASRSSSRPIVVVVARVVSAL